MLCHRDVNSTKVMPLVVNADCAGMLLLVGWPCLAQDCVVSKVLAYVVQAVIAFEAVNCWPSARGVMNRPLPALNAFSLMCNSL